VELKIMSIKKERKIPQLCLIEFSLLKKVSLAIYYLEKKIEKIEKTKRKTKMALAHPLPKRLPALYRPLVPATYYARKSCNHVQISIICLKCEFFARKNSHFKQMILIWTWLQLLRA
jgi:hypothetical protein